MEENLSEDDNKHRQTSDLLKDSNMNDGTESAKRLKTDEDVSIGVDNAVKYSNGVDVECSCLINTDPTSTSNINETPQLVIQENHIMNCQNKPNATENAESVLREFRSLTPVDDSSSSTVFENRISSELYSEDELEPASSILENEDDQYEEEEDHPVMKKTKPKHNWFMIPEIANRQLGYCSKKNDPELFQSRCYGSLHCAQRLELMYKLDKHDGCVNSLNFNPSGTLLASGSDDLNIIIWDWKVGKALLHYDSQHRSNVLQSKFLDFNGDLIIATCARDGQVRLSQVSAQEGLRSNRKIGSHKGSCHKLALLHGQPFNLLSAGEDGIVLRYDVRDSKPEKLLCAMSNEGKVVSLYSIDGNPLKPHEFCLSGRDSVIRSYDQRKCGGKAQPLNVYFPKTEWQAPSESPPLHVTCAIYNHNGSEILASYSDDDIYLFDIDGMPGTFVHHYQGHRNGATIKGVNFFGPKSEFVISGSDCGNVYIWEKNTEAIVNWMMSDENGVTNCLEPHPRFPFLCTSGLDWDIKVWVPSCEKDPLMTGLANIVRSNEKTRSNQLRNGIGENRIIWMLFRHFHNQNRTFNYHEEESTYSSGSSSNSDSNSDALEGVSDCSPS